MTAATKTANAQPTNKPASPAAPKETKMATPKIDTSSMSVEELLKLSEELKQKAHAQSQKLFDDTINFLANEKLPAMGRSKVQAAFALYELMSDQEKKDFNAFFISKKSASASGAPKVKGEKKQPEYFDSTGAAPELNSKYKFADGQEYVTGDQRKKLPGWVKEKLVAGETYAKTKVK